MTKKKDTITNRKHQEFLLAYDNYSEAIFRHCYLRISDRERAKELMHETFMRIWNYLMIRGGEIKQIRAFLYRTANNLIIDEYRKHKTSSLDELQEKGFNPGVDDREELHNQIEAKEMLLMLKGIDEKYREVIVLRYVDGLLPREIAHVIGATENNVSVRIHRGLSQIRKLLDKQKD